MLSGRLIHLIESHWDPITIGVLQRIHHDPELTHIGSLPARELRECGESILRNLGNWLSAPTEDEAAAHYEWLGRLRCQEDVPLAESVRALSIFKTATLDFVQSENPGRSTLDYYAEEELEHRIGRFFDMLTFHLVRGYEEALRATVS
jgi:hypothetical protein